MQINKNISLIIFSLLLNLTILSGYEKKIIEIDSISNMNTTTVGKSPLGALIRSAILPGWGQYYNESYWKIPVIIGVFSWFAYNWNQNNLLYLDYSKKYNEAINTGLTGFDSQYKRLRDFYKDERDLFTIYMVLSYALNILDAYVDAHLFDFNIVNDLKSIQIKLKYKF